MAVSNTYEQAFRAPSSIPSGLPTSDPTFYVDARRSYLMPFGTDLTRRTIKAPWDGVIELVRVIQDAPGAAGVNTQLAIAVDGTDCYAVATDGDCFDRGDAAGTEGVVYPTANLTAQDDGEDRVEFSRGDLIVISMTNEPALCSVEIQIAKKVPQSV